MRLIKIIILDRNVVNNNNNDNGEGRGERERRVGSL